MLIVRHNTTVRFLRLPQHVPFHERINSGLRLSVPSAKLLQDTNSSRTPIHFIVVCRANRILHLLQGVVALTNLCNKLNCRQAIYKSIKSILYDVCSLALHLIFFHFYCQFYSSNFTYWTYHNQREILLLFEQRTHNTRPHRSKILLRLPPL